MIRSVILALIVLGWSSIADAQATKPAVGGMVTPNQGTSVSNPGTGQLEMLLPIQVNSTAGSSGACTSSCIFATGDFFKLTRRSNSGSAMTDSFPASSATALINGTRIDVFNADATANLTINAGSGTTILGSGSISLSPGHGYWFVYNASLTEWFLDATTGTPGTGTVSAGGGAIVPTSGSPGTLYLEQQSPGGRLTVTSGTPIITASVTGQTTLYYAPFSGEWVPIYDGTNMELHQFTSGATDTVGLSLALGSSWTASTNYDVFVTLNSGNPVLCTGPAWSSNTARAAAGSIGLYKGIAVNSNASAMTCRTANATTISVTQYQATNVGTIRINATGGQIDYTFGAPGAPPTAASFGVWNRYNQKPTSTTNVYETTANWVYSTSAVREANGDTTYAVNYIDGAGVVPILANYGTGAEAAAAGTQFCSTGLGVNSTTAYSGSSSLIATANWSTARGFYTGAPGLGWNSITANEGQNGTGNCTFLGTSSDNVGALSVTIQN